MKLIVLDDCLPSSVACDLTEYLLEYEKGIYQNVDAEKCYVTKVHKFDDFVASSPIASKLGQLFDKIQLVFQTLTSVPDIKLEHSCEIFPKFFDNGGYMVAPTYCEEVDEESFWFEMILGDASDIWCKRDGGALSISGETLEVDPKFNRLCCFVTSPSNFRIGEVTCDDKLLVSLFGRIRLPPGSSKKMNQIFICSEEITPTFWRYARQRFLCGTSPQVWSVQLTMSSPSVEIELVDGYYYCISQVALIGETKEIVSAFLEVDHASVVMGSLSTCSCEQFSCDISLKSTAKRHHFRIFLDNYGDNSSPIQVFVTGRVEKIYDHPHESDDPDAFLAQIQNETFNDVTESSPVLQKSDIILEEFSDEDHEFLSTFIRSTYLTKQGMERIRNKFCKNSKLELSSFLNEAYAGVVKQAILDDMDHSERWEKFSGAFASFSTLTKVAMKDRFHEVLFDVQKRLFYSKPFMKWINAVTTLLPVSGSIEINRFDANDFTTHQHYVQVCGQEKSLNISLAFVRDQTIDDLVEDLWKEGDFGGYECFVDVDLFHQFRKRGSDEDSLEGMDVDDFESNQEANSYELFNCAPEFNKLSIVLCDEGVAKYVKYLSKRCPSPRYQVAGYYRLLDIDDEDDDEDEDHDDEDSDDNNDDDSDEGDNSSD